ncbi:MAG: PIG-L family deacetylase, partial [Candidatus Omnitrophota bacterium]|jgi:LmbE family N-acetylglucosaminyl deacetylase
MNIMLHRLVKIFCIFSVCLASYLFLPACSFADSPISGGCLDQFRKDERILILAPHPDDEAIACAGIIQEALARGAKIKIAYLTNGEHNEFAFIVYEKRITFKKNEFIHLGKVRRNEAIKAMQLLGVGEKDLIFLGYPDFGTFSIFNRYWQKSKPFHSLLTRISSVPYKESLSFGAPYLGESILADLKKVIFDYRPDRIFVSHPADVNVDHKSLYLFLRVALADLKDSIPYPKIYPYLVHHSGWPLPRHYHPELYLNPPNSFSDSQINWLRFDLTPEQLSKKHKAILSYKSQTASSAFYLLAFARRNELFGDYLPIDLKNQVFLEEKLVSFFGYSKMFLGSTFDQEFPDSNISEDKEGVSYALVDRALVIKVEKPKNLVYRFFTMMYIFGYSYGKPFAEMPKLRIITQHDHFKVLDGKRLINPRGIILDLTSQALILKIPLEIIGSPDFIITSANVYRGKSQGGDSAVDTIGFRRINLAP